jgi:hypothetical protein
MKTFVIISMFAATLLTATATVSFGQNAGDQEKGSTGWGGGSKDQVSQSAGNPTTNGKAVEAYDQAEAKDQPPIATGEDLKGPAVQLAPSKTPE